LVGDILIRCTGGDPTQAFTANFQLFLNTNITSRILGAGLSEATLLIDEPGRVIRPTPFCASPGSVSNSAPDAAGGVSAVPGLPVGGLFGTGTAPACNPAAAAGTFQRGTYTAFRAQPVPSANGTANGAVLWAGIPVVPPGTANERTFRITNVRANAAGVAASTSPVPSQIFAFLSVTGSQSLALNPQLAVAFVLPGLQFDLTGCNGSGSGNPSFTQCTSLNGSFVTDPSGTSTFPTVLGLRFREGFPTAFKPRIQTGSQANGASVPGAVYNSESGFVRTEFGAAPGFGGVGVADFATRVAARFNNVPAGVAIYVSTSNVSSTTNTSVGSPNATAFLVSVSDPNGSGFGTVTGGGGSATVGVASTTTITCSATGGPASSGAAQVPITNGSGVAVWEVLDSNPGGIDTLFFQVGGACSSNVAQKKPVLGTATVTGNFAPFYAASANAGVASSALPIPRFIDTTTPRNLFTVTQCVSNLLFPFVTNQAGFDTGMAIVNTSNDTGVGFAGSSAGRQQAGTCDVNYFGATTAGPAPAKQTTRSIPSGDMVAFMVSGGGNAGGNVTGAPGFQGYVIARCGFQYAHGFAFITGFNNTVAEGYLALVMDTNSGSRTGSTSEVLGQ